MPWRSRRRTCFRPSYFFQLAVLRFLLANFYSYGRFSWLEPQPSRVSSRVTITSFVWYIRFSSSPNCCWLMLWYWSLRGCPLFSAVIAILSCRQTSQLIDQSLRSSSSDLLAYCARRSYVFLHSMALSNQVQWTWLYDWWACTLWSRCFVSLKTREVRRYGCWHGFYSVSVWHVARQLYSALALATAKAFAAKTFTVVCKYFSRMTQSYSAELARNFPCLVCSKM